MIDRSVTAHGRAPFTEPPATVASPPASWVAGRRKRESGETPPAKRSVARSIAEPPTPGQYGNLDMTQLSTANRKVIAQSEVDAHHPRASLWRSRPSGIAVILHRNLRQSAPSYDQVSSGPSHCLCSRTLPRKLGLCERLQALHPIHSERNQ